MFFHRGSFAVGGLDPHIRLLLETTSIRSLSVFSASESHSALLDHIENSIRAIKQGSSEWKKLKSFHINGELKHFKLNLPQKLAIQDIHNKLNNCDPQLFLSFGVSQDTTACDVETNVDGFDITKFEAVVNYINGFMGENLLMDDLDIEPNKVFPNSYFIRCPMGNCNKKYTITWLQRWKKLTFAGFRKHMKSHVSEHLDNSIIIIDSEEPQVRI